MGGCGSGFDAFGFGHRFLLQNGGFDRVNKVGPAPAEVLRVWPDDSFDLIAGDPRVTEWGLKSPISGYGAGFDSAFGGYMWRCGLYDGTIYFGTYDSSVFMSYATTLDDRARHILEPDVIDRYLDLRGGCELWGSADGERWVPVTRNGFGNRYNFGFRTLIGTPVGLFAGAANPFGPMVAERNAYGWRYEANPRGGCEIFFGSHQHTGEDISTPPIEVRTRTVDALLETIQQSHDVPPRSG